LNAPGRKIIDLASGASELPPHWRLNAALIQSTHDPDGHFAYGDPRGEKKLRQSICDHLVSTQALHYDADAEVLVTSGASAALTAALMAFCNAGDGVAIFEPFFENFDSTVRIFGGRPLYVPLHAPGLTFDPDALACALSGNTRLLILNTPHNPTGRVFNTDEMDTIAKLCVEKNIIVISDEVYADVTFGPVHCSIAAYPGMRERTILIHSWSKSLRAPGWKVGSVVAPEPLCKAMRTVSDLALGGTSPHVQIACAEMLPHVDEWLHLVLPVLHESAIRLHRCLSQFGFVVSQPEGATYLWADCRHLPFESEEAVCRFLLEQKGILAVPGKAFFPEAHPLIAGEVSHHLRFCFARLPATIDQVAKRF
jgi:aspartate/methionine/tyrosine aminotransferase